MEKKIMIIEESLYEFAKRGRPAKKGKKPSLKMRGIDAPDSWNDTEEEGEIDPEELDVDTSDMTSTDEIEIEEDVFDDKLFKALSNEVKLLEPNRRLVKFRLKHDSSKIRYGIPMAKIGNNAFIFKLNNGEMKKIYLRDIILEKQKMQDDDRAFTINE